MLMTTHVITHRFYLFTRKKNIKKTYSEQQARTWFPDVPEHSKAKPPSSATEDRVTANHHRHTIHSTFTFSSALAVW